MDGLAGAEQHARAIITKPAHVWYPMEGFKLPSWASMDMNAFETARQIQKNMFNETCFSYDLFFPMVRCDRHAGKVRQSIMEALFSPK